MSTLKKILLIVAGVIVVGFVGLVAIGLWADSASGDVYVQIDIPSEVNYANNFEITVTLTNLIDEDQSLDSIDIGDTFLEGIMILSAEPSYYETYHIPIDNTVSHTFDELIPASGELVVVFQATPINSGIFSGDFDVCINGPASCQFLSIGTIVVE